MKITSWGNYPLIDGEVLEFSTESELRRLLSQTKECIVRGMGRSYGDSALHPTMISTLKFNRFLAFDPVKGILSCESGVTLAEILEVIVPKGWFLKVTPGTKDITIGGAIGSNVHGKNHHKAGAFSDHLLQFKMMKSDGETLVCSPEKNSELFRETCGGMGLTGIVLEATIQLEKIESIFIKQTSIRAANLEEIMTLIEESEETTYSVAWTDCLAKGKSLGRSYLMLGEFATAVEAKAKYKRRDPLALPRKSKLNVPFFMPNMLTSGLVNKVFNSLLYYKHIPKTKVGWVTYESFFYPLDIVKNWNRLYGRRGFTQYQIVLPSEASKEGFTHILSLIAQKNIGAYLSILKTFGESSGGSISFPQKGYTLTLDIPIGKKALAFMDLLDELVLEYGGRLYLTKDVRMRAKMFKKSYPKAEGFIQVKHQADRENRFQSLQSKRLEI